MRLNIITNVTNHRYRLGSYAKQFKISNEISINFHCTRTKPLVSCHPSRMFKKSQSILFQLRSTLGYLISFCCTLGIYPFSVTQFKLWYSYRILTVDRYKTLSPLITHLFLLPKIVKSLKPTCIESPNPPLGQKALYPPSGTTSGEHHRMSPL